MINLSDLKADKIRKTFNVDINGDIQEVVIYNLLGEERNELKNKLSEVAQKGLEDIKLIEEVYTDVFMNCTNIVIDDELIEVLNAPTGNMLKVMQEVYDIIYEIQTEEMLEKYRNLCDLQSTEYAKLMLLKTQETLLVTEECKKVDKNIKKLEKEFFKKDDGNDVQ